MSYVIQNTIDKDYLIDSLIKKQYFKMPDGRQFYEASEQELKDLLNSDIHIQPIFFGVDA
ncbi:hypothetical protein BTR23_18010 [Alkalihalophilus pseudofirmus]|uniref:Fur-regulated basic protein FbpA n=1 Tax=Alkalihalobacterium alkalinitrilicum TaxID=427920 RepID=UPI00094DC5B7|nr:Fur-regulated basic protein FbpA [Alkalihalobacterium alkalinitrilicum]OLO28176.1 hypothetical protein BTR23_18010 [Alkalihalophilus pseudofirmus]